MQVASSEVVRDINRRVVLNLIRTKQPISRADLARVSGLQRSTISLIVESLIEEHWVLEGATGRLPRGRRPTFLRLNDDRVIIGIDIRPVQTTVALADVNGRFSSQEVMATPSDPKAAVAGPGRAHRTSHWLLRPQEGRRHRHQPARPSRKKLRTGWFLRRILSGRNSIFAVPSGHGSRSRTGECRECLRPRGRLVRSRAEPQPGGGDGLGRNRDRYARERELARGMSGMAGEFGHVPLDPKGPLCSCGSHGCWEVFASNRAALRVLSESRKTPAT